MGFFRRRSSTTAATLNRPLTPNSAHLSSVHHPHHPIPVMFAHIPEPAHTLHHSYGPPPAYSPSPTMNTFYPAPPPSSRHHHPVSYIPAGHPLPHGYPSPHHRYAPVAQTPLQRSHSTRGPGGYPIISNANDNDDELDPGYEADHKRGLMRSLVDLARGRSKSRSGRGSAAAAAAPSERSRSRSHADYSGSDYDAKNRSSSSDRGRRDRRDRDRDSQRGGASGGGGLNGFEKDMLRALDKAVRDDPVSKEDRYRNATLPMAIPGAPLPPSSNHHHRTASAKEELRRKLEEEDRQARKYRDSAAHSSSGYSSHGSSTQGYDSDYHHRQPSHRDRDRRYSAGGNGSSRNHHQRSLSRGSTDSTGTAHPSDGISESPTLREHTAFNARQLGGAQRPTLLHRGQTAPHQNHHYHTDVPQSNKLVRRSTAPPPQTLIPPGSAHSSAAAASSVAPGSPHASQQQQQGSPVTGKSVKAPVGWFNSRGDQLLDSVGNILRLPQHLEYPPHLKAYPAPGTGWQDHLGQIVGPDLKWRRKVG